MITVSTIACPPSSMVFDTQLPGEIASLTIVRHHSLETAQTEPACEVAEAVVFESRCSAHLLHKRFRVLKGFQFDGLCGLQGSRLQEAVFPQCPFHGTRWELGTTSAA